VSNESNPPAFVLQRLRGIAAGAIANTLVIVEADFHRIVSFRAGHP
jgi:hypothetical protein